MKTGGARARARGSREASRTAGGHPGGAMAGEWFHWSGVRTADPALGARTSPLAAPRGRDALGDGLQCLDPPGQEAADRGGDGGDGAPPDSPGVQPETDTGIGERGVSRGQQAAAHWHGAGAGAGGSATACALEVRSFPCDALSTTPSAAVRTVLCAVSGPQRCQLQHRLMSA